MMVNPGRLPGRLAQFERHRGAPQVGYDNLNGMIKEGTGRHYFAKPSSSGDAMIILEPEPAEIPRTVSEEEALSLALEDAYDDEWLRRLLRKQFTVEQATKVRSPHRCRSRSRGHPVA
jgi:hypothetical protein